MKQRFKDQYDDTLRAIELDDTYIKAYMVNGEALIELGKVEENTAKIEKGIMRLRKALSMCMSQGQRSSRRRLSLRSKRPIRSSGTRITSWGTSTRPLS